VIASKDTDRHWDADIGMQPSKLSGDFHHHIKNIETFFGQCFQKDCCVKRHNFALRVLKNFLSVQK
jgi:hypothetical protein